MRSLLEKVLQRTLIVMLSKTIVIRSWFMIEV